MDPVNYFAPGGGSLRAAWTQDGGAEVSVVRADGAEDYWSCHEGMTEVTCGHQRADGVSFDTSLGTVAPGVRREVRRLATRRAITPGEALMRLCLGTE